MNAAKTYQLAKRLLILPTMFSISAFLSCEESEAIEAINYEEIWESDSIIIDNYFNNYFNFIHLFKK